MKEVSKFELTIVANNPLLTPEYRQYLNPLQICIASAKNLPVYEEKTDEDTPVYVMGKFFNGEIIKTHELPRASKCKWMYKQVFLLGLMSHAQLKETILSKFLEVKEL